MAAIKQIKVGDVTYDIKAKQDIDGNDIATTYVKKDGEKVLSTEDFTTELKNKLDGIATNANNYTHPSNSGNKHIPAGGSKGKILVWKADGEAQWGDDKDTTPAKVTTNADGLMSKEDKAKLDGVAANANNYSHPTGNGNNHIPQGGAKGQFLGYSTAGTAKWVDAPTISISAATNTTLGGIKIGYTQSNKNYPIVLDGDGKAYVVVPWTDTVYTHPNTTGNKHIPAGGSSGQILVWASDGTAKWGNDNNTTYSAFKGATSSAAGGSGLVPAPAQGDNSSKYLKADGTWQTPPNTTYSTATASVDGLMSGTDKAKLDGIASGANNYILPAAGTSIGGVKKGAAVTDAVSGVSATAENVATQLNALLASLRTAGIIAS